MKRHVPVLLKEAVDYLNVKRSGKYIDATYGAGGHSREILTRGGAVLALDVSPAAVEAAEKDPNLKVIRGNFRKLGELAWAEGFGQVDGILFDLGVSSDELEKVQGLSFQRDEPLDMRLDPDLGVTAADLVNALPESKLAELFKEYGDEPNHKFFARALVRARNEKKIETTGELLQALGRPQGQRFERIHPATRIFQALRIAVNDELEALREALPQAKGLLKPGGRLVVISFHSGEDRIVKDFIKVNMKSLADKPIQPSGEEISTNPRARSAKLRAAEN